MCEYYIKCLQMSQCTIQVLKNKPEYSKFNSDINIIAYNCININLLVYYINKMF